MPAKLSPYSLPPAIHSVLLLKTPESIPLTVDLESTHAELLNVRKGIFARGKKASEDLKTIDESMRQMKEKEKGKAKAVDKVKRERDCTYYLFRRVSHFLMVQNNISIPGPFYEFLQTISNPGFIYISCAPRLASPL